MSSYKNIPLWENSRRRRVLEEFRKDVVSYFRNSSSRRMRRGRAEATEAVQARQRINLTVAQARRICSPSCSTPRLHHRELTPDPPGEQSTGSGLLSD